MILYHVLVSPTYLDQIRSTFDLTFVSCRRRRPRPKEGGGMPNSQLTEQLPRKRQLVPAPHATKPSANALFPNTTNPSAIDAFDLTETVFPIYLDKARGRM